MRDTLGETDLVEQGLRARYRIAWRYTGNPQRHRHVLDRGELWQQVMELKNEPDLPIAKCDPRVVVGGGDVHVVDHNGAVVDPIEAPHHLQQRGLPDARRAHDGDHLAALDRQIEPPKNRQLAVAHRVRLRERPHLEERHYEPR